MTERARKIQIGKRQRAMEALKHRHREDGMLWLRDDEAAVLMKWIGDLSAERIIKPVSAEYEGDRKSTWWYVCGECHGTIDTNDRYCRHCGNEIDWSGCK
jgi:hypothetical protein